jgi:uncharacterized phiE125 gp8 family phage protein
MICSPALGRNPTSYRRMNSSAVVGEQIISPPTDYPISVADAKKQVELPADAPSHDDHFGRLIAAATRYLQDQTYRQFLVATYKFFYDQFPPGMAELFVPRAPLVSITSIAYLDTAGVSQTMPTADYQVATNCLPGRVSLKALGARRWPQALQQGQAITITAVCGYATAADVPEDVKLVLLWLVNEWFNGRSGEDSPSGWVSALIESLRLGDDFIQYAPVAGDPAYIGYG